MLEHDPIPWLMTAEGEAAVRARSSLGLAREDDNKVKRSVAGRLAKSQLRDGSFDHSPMKTAGVLCLLADLAPESSEGVVSRAGEFLFDVLQSQPGYHKASHVRPGTLTTPCDLGGFFGPHEARNEPHVLAHGAREVNFLREFEPLLGPKSPVRTERRSSFDRPNPGCSYTWGLMPLCYIIEALARAGSHADPRLKPGVNVLLGAQRCDGGWCRNLGGGFPCTMPALRALGAHPKLRRGDHAKAVLAWLRESQSSPWRGSMLFAALDAVARFDLALADPILADGLKAVARHQRQNGSFGTPCRVERVAAVIAAHRRLEMMAR